MTVTKLDNLINPEVMADMIAANLPAKVKFAPLAEIDTTLVGQAGDSVTVPKWTYIGDAQDMVEGEEMVAVPLTASTTTATIKQVGQTVEISDKAALSGYGDPIGAAEDNIEKSLAAKIDNDFVDALKGAKLAHNAATDVISYESVVDAVDKFEEEDDEVKVLFVHPKQVTQLRKDPEFLANVPDAFMTGVVGEIAGCQVVKSTKVPFAADKYTNFIVKEGAITLYLKRQANVETDRNIKAKNTIIAADVFYAAVLSDDSKVVKLTTKATPAG